MRAPTETELTLLRLVAAEPLGIINQEDERLAPFCDDASTLSKPDTFNQCLDLGWLKAWHDHDTSSSTAELTAEGRLHVLRTALYMCASHFQGAHNAAGDAAAQALGVPFPVTMTALERKAKQDGYSPDWLWPWLKPMRTGTR